MFQDVISISLKALREYDIYQIKKQLLEVHNFNKIVVNAVDYIDLKIFCIALFKAMEAGKRFIFRTAASFVKVIGGITDQDLLKREDMITNHS